MKIENKERFKANISNSSSVIKNKFVTLIDSELVRADVLASEAHDAGEHDQHGFRQTHAAHVPLSKRANKPNTNIFCHSCCFYNHETSIFKRLTFIYFLF